jgi:hypothetical protein
VEGRRAKVFGLELRTWRAAMAAAECLLQFGRDACSRLDMAMWSSNAST